MAITDRERLLLHLVVRRYDRDAGSAYLDPVGLEEELNLSVHDAALTIDALEEKGYLRRLGEGARGDSDPWLLAPTDKGVLAAMGLEE